MQPLSSGFTSCSCKRAYKRPQSDSRYFCQFVMQSINIQRVQPKQAAPGLLAPGVGCVSPPAQ